MSYLVLARKYRPAFFPDLVGQEHVMQTLQNAITMDRVHHAFLFTGARGVGKTTTARLLAKALNCEAGPTPNPCGDCPSCAEIGAGTSPDVLEIDGASNNGIDNVRELRENVRYLPSRGKYKLYIIDEVHMLSQAAFNALLKTLEEPPAHVKFIFATTEPQKIPVTILSRCQRFDFRKVSPEQLTAHLKGILDKEGLELGMEALGYIVREAQGSVRDALSLLDQVLSYGGDRLDDATVIEALGVVDRQTIFQLCDAILQKEASRLLDLVGEVDARGHDMADVAELVVEHLRDVMVAKVSEEPGRVLRERAPAELSALVEQAGQCERSLLHRLFSLAVRMAEDVSRSLSPRVSLEMGLLRLLEAESAQSLGALLKKIDAVMRGESGVGGARIESAPVQSAAAKAVEPSAPAKIPEKTAPPSPPRPASPVQQEQQEQRSPPKEAPPAPVSAREPERVVEPSGKSWADFVGGLQGAGPALASVLQHGNLFEFGPREVKLGYERGSFYWESVHEPENRDLITSQLRDYFGQPTRFSIVEAEGDKADQPATLAEMVEQEGVDREEQIRNDAIAHPAVVGAIAVLGGEVENVTPLEANS
ncbi:MAG: DNA polymerase III subunit gamma/tau [Myxococcota bacterium]|nr:DNA polymerase III subunit gamma/tau [Myxococcota bacterium]